MIPLLHTAKELLATAVSQMFPDALLLGGEISEIGFSYSFLFKKKHQLNNADLKRIEEQVQQLIFQDIPIVHKEMMRENAAVYFDHLGQQERAIQIGEMEMNIVSIFEMDGFVDVCPHPFAEKSGELHSLKLLQVGSRGETTTISGAVFETKEDAKEFIKNYKLAEKTDHRHLLVKNGEGMFMHNECVALLPKGERRYQELVSWWEGQIKSFSSARILPLPRDINPKTFFLNFFKNQSGCRRVSALFDVEFDLTLGPQRGLLSLPKMTRDWTVSLAREEEVAAEFISSLQFMSKAIKIFPFETALFLVGSKRAFLREMLRKEQIPFKEEVSSPFPKGEEVGGARIEFRAQDRYKMSWPLGLLEVMEGPNGGSMIGWSIFGAIERVIALSIEFGGAVR